MGVVTVIEHAIKKPVFGCRMCGQCVLHDTGMTCVWAKAEERSRTLPLLPRSWRGHFHELRPPVDNRLHGTSSWVNLVTKRDKVRPAGWVATDEGQA
jgi:hypothetical protein